MAKKKTDNVYGPTVVTPKGALMFGYIQKPDTYEGKTRYKAKLRIQPEQLEEFKKKCDKFAAEAGEKVGKKFPARPWDQDEETGEYILKAHSAETKPPQVEDAKGNPIPESVRVWNGSGCRFAVVLYAYTGFGGGISCLLERVRVYDLKTGGQGEEFEDEDGYVTDTSEERVDAEDTSEDTEEFPDDGEIPF